LDTLPLPRSLGASLTDQCNETTRPASSKRLGTNISSHARDRSEQIGSGKLDISVISLRSNRFAPFVRYWMATCFCTTIRSLDVFRMARSQPVLAEQPADGAISESKRIAVLFQKVLASNSVRDKNAYRNELKN
jgi:hypothetical protein